MILEGRVEDRSLGASPVKSLEKPLANASLSEISKRTISAVVVCKNTTEDEES